MHIGKTIVELRTARGLSQQEFADLLFVSRELVSKWETGLRSPEYPMIEQIAAICGVSVENIIDKHDLIFEELTDCCPDGADIPDEKLAEAMNAFLHKLSAREADIFVNRYYFLKTTSEIASEYRIRENHVRSILSKTRAKLKKYLSKELKI